MQYGARFALSLCCRYSEDEAAAAGTTVELVPNTPTPHQHLCTALSMLIIHLAHELFPPHQLSRLPLRSLLYRRHVRAGGGHSLPRLSLLHRSSSLCFYRLGSGGPGRCGGSGGGSLGGGKRGSVQAKAAPPTEHEGPVSVPADTGDLDGNVEHSRIRGCVQRANGLHECLCALGEGTI